MSERWRTLGWLAVLSLLPVAVLYVGRPGDDAMFHLSSWMEMAAAWRSGVWAPAWAAQANFGLGEPRFMFYPPLTIVLGAALRMILPAVMVPGVMVWLALVVAGLCMSALAGDVLPAEDRGRAVMLYGTSYYLVVVAVLRFAMGELLAGALLPLVLLFFLRAMRAGERRPKMRDMAGLALALAAVWISDVPAAVATFYVLLVVSLVESVRRKGVAPLVMLGMAEALAVGLSGWYLVPALVERGKIGAASLLHFSTMDFMLGHRPAKGLTPAMMYPLWAWVLMGTVAAVWLGIKARNKREPVRLIGMMAGVVLLFQLPVSLPLWRLLPQLGFVQFPYRFDGMLGCVLPVVGLLLVRKAKSRRWMYAGWALFLVIALGTKAMQERAGRGGMTFATMVVQVENGYAGYEEFSTKGVASVNVATEKVASVGDCAATVEVWAPERRVFGSVGSEGCVYRVGLRYYPDWHVWVDGQELGGMAAGEGGLMMVKVPAGRHAVELRYVRPVKAGVLGIGVSGIALLGIVGAWIGGKRRHALMEERVAMEAFA